MPGIWKRVEEMFTANTHADLDQMENPAHMSQQVLREIDAELDALRPRLVACLAAQKKLTQSCCKVRTQIEQHQKRAQAALGADEEDEARQHLKRKLQAEQEHKQLSELKEQQAQWVQALKTERTELLQEREELSNKARLMQLRSGLPGGASPGTPYGQSLQRRERMDRYTQANDNGLNELLASHTLRHEELGQQDAQGEAELEEALQQLKADTLKENAA